jgi:hypothetical protein
MLVVLPALEIMAAVTDNNISSPASQLRRDSFTVASELQTVGSVQIVLEGLVYERITPRLNADHKRFFETAYRVDQSAIGIPNYGTIQGITFVAKKESELSKVLILTDNPGYYTELPGKIFTMAPSAFLQKNAGLQQVLQAIDKLPGVDKSFKLALTNKAIEETFCNHPHHQRTA